MNIADQVFTLGVFLVLVAAAVIAITDFRPRPKYGGWCRFECIHGRDEMTEPCPECNTNQRSDMDIDEIKTVLKEMRTRKVGNKKQYTSPTLLNWAARIEIALYEKFSDRDPTALKSRVEKAEAFKTYVHERLDAMGVPHSVPESEHDKAGCRVGGRLDFIEGELERLRGAFDDTDEKASVHWYVEWVGMRKALRQIVAIEHQEFGGDYEEIIEAQRIASVALGADDAPPKTDT